MALQIGDFEGGDEVETNLKMFLKNSITLGDIAFRNVLLFLKIVTKWHELQKSRLNNIIL